eukprot:384371-Pyramimonas_sp.AAC.1
MTDECKINSKPKTKQNQRAKLKKKHYPLKRPCMETPVKRGPYPRRRWTKHFKQYKGDKKYKKREEIPNLETRKMVLPPRPPPPGMWEAPPQDPYATKVPSPLTSSTSGVRAPRTPPRRSRSWSITSGIPPPPKAPTHRWW